MKKGWRIVTVVVLVALLLGAVCVGVGMLTGADSVRIFNLLDDKYHITMYVDYAQQVIELFMSELA